MHQSLHVLRHVALQGMDIYSNILYVKEQFAELSHLAHRLAATDKYRPESCCVIGNYYSLKGQHEKAVEYFRRALRLNRTYLSAWTLMGHEYVELKNAPAAIGGMCMPLLCCLHQIQIWHNVPAVTSILDTCSHVFIGVMRCLATAFQRNGS